MKRLGLAALCVALSAGCGEDALCSAEELTAALAAARPGETVTLGECRVTGQFTVPAGVALVGAGPASVIEAPSGRTALRLTPSTPATRVASLAVSSGGARLAIYASGAGDVTIEDVTIDVSLGLGIGIENTTNVTIARTRLRGPITAANATDSRPMPTPEITATHGVVLVRAGNAMLTDVSVRGFAIQGSELVETTTTWLRGDSDENLSAGIVVIGGALTFDSASVSGTFSGTSLLPLPYGIVAASGARIVTRNASIERNQSIGIMHADGVVAEHHDIMVTSNTGGGLWLEAASGFTLDGTGSMLSDNSFAAIVARGTPGIMISDATIQTTRRVMRVFPGFTAMNVGDGVQLVDSHVGTMLSNVRLTNNGRAGVLFDLGGAALTGAPCSGVTIEATGTALGAVTQNGMPDPAWDSGITRLGDTLMNDAAFTGGADVAGIVTPTDLPRVGAASGIAGIVTPTD